MWSWFMQRMDGGTRARCLLDAHRMGRVNHSALRSAIKHHALLCLGLLPIAGCGADKGLGPTPEATAVEEAGPPEAALRDARALDGLATTDAIAAHADAGDAAADVSHDVAHADSSADSGGTTTSHRPSGLTTLFEYDFSAPLPAVTGGSTSGLITTPPTYYMIDVTNEPSRYPGAWTMISDPTAPAGSSSVLQISWPTGLWYDGAKQEPGTVALGNSGGTTYGRYYLGIWSKLLSTSATGGTGFELTYDGPGIKSLGYVSVGDAMNPPRGVYFILYDPAAPNGASNGVTAGPLALEMDAQIGNSIYYALPQGYGGTGANPAASKAPLIPLDTWVYYEFYFQLDTMTGGASNKDGWFQGWFNGTLAFDYRNVQYRSSTYTAGFYQWDGDLVWGGTSKSAKVRTDYQYLAYATGAGE
jgi:hypothetical protein